MIPSVANFLAAPVRSCAAAFLAGVALVFSFAPFQGYLLTPVLIALLLLFWEKATPREAVRSGFAFGSGLFIAGTWWLYISLKILGGLWPPLAILLMVGLVLAMAAYYALTGYLTVQLAPAGTLMRWLVVFPAAWTLCEWLRGWVLTGFPWMSIGYSQTETPLGALAPVAGVYGVTWLTVLFAGVLVALVCGNLQRRIVALLAALLAGGGILLLDGYMWTVPAGESLNARLVQGAVPQEKKWLPSQLQPTLDLYTELSAGDAPADLIVWPEAAVPALPYEVRDFLEELHTELVAGDTQLFLGILSFDSERDVFLNSLWAMGEESGEYHKRHLVPFGEYFPVPTFVRRVMRMMNLPSENIASGAALQEPLYVKGIPVAPTICYEIAYGSEQLAFFPAAQLLVNVSNDGWFGNTIAPHQHLQINQFRARETGRYMVRATNTGVTAAIDADGRVLARLPQFQPGVLDAVVVPRVGTTPYMRWGNWLAIGLAMLLMALPALQRRVRAAR